MKTTKYIDVFFEKLVHGGEALGFYEGKAVFAFNALPGETARVELHTIKKDFAKGVAVEILKSSPDRAEPISDDFLINSPWQILKFDRENFYKKEILKETFKNLAKLELPEFEIKTDGKEFGYRNKMEFNFCDDADGKIALAFYERGTHHKVPIVESILADEKINEAARQIVAALNDNNVSEKALKTLVLRGNGKNVLAALFVKDRLRENPSSGEDVSAALTGFKPRPPLVGFEIYSSRWQSPASTPDNLLARQGLTFLEQNLNGKKFKYDALNFFQVNIPVYEMVLRKITEQLAPDEKTVDMYCGVGSIGIATNRNNPLVGIDGDVDNIALAKKNAEENNITNAEFHTTPDFRAMDFIAGDATLILDPPRAGIHPKLIATILEKLPPKIIYLSCNPSTQARDIELLKQHYSLTFFEAYNFFPRTPHIESLVILERS